MSSEVNEQASQQKPRASVGLPDEILSDREESEVRKRLHDANPTISSANSEIVRLHSSTQPLNEQCAGEFELTPRLQVGLSPAKKVPPELLGLIFEYCAGDDDYKIGIPPHPGSQCLTLSQVCSPWRRAALSEPSLWNRVSIDFPDSILPDVLEAILSRAGSAITLHLTVDLIPHRICHVLVQYSDKFRTVDLTLDPSRPAEPLKIPFERLGALKNLRVSVMEDMELREAPLFYSAILSFANAQNLQRLDVQPKYDYACVDVSMPGSFSFPWFHLRHLTISAETSIVGILRILAQCTRLESCDILLDRNEDPGSFLATIVLTNLHSLRITSVGINLDWVLDLLVTPSLRVLKMKNFHTTPDTLLHFIHRSECNIQIIDAALMPSLSPHVDQLIHAIPRAMKLKFRGIYTLSKATLDSLSTRELLPDLEVLKVFVSSCKSTQDLVSNRCDPRPDDSQKAIRKFTAWVADTDVTDEWREFQRSLSKGGAVQVQFM